MTDVPVSQEAREAAALVEAIEEAGRGYRIELTRLVDGVSTYELHYRDSVYEYECTDDAYAALREMARSEKITAANDFLARHRQQAEREALARMEGWRPIETAPKDGTEIDVWINGEFPGRRTDVSWRKPTDSEWWVHGGDTIETPDATWHDCFGPLGSCEQPTHWQPLPTPPAGEA